MEKLIIKKSKPLNGKISINGSKNSALPILVTSLLTGKECIFKNIPNVSFYILNIPNATFQIFLIKDNLYYWVLK